MKQAETDYVRDLYSTSLLSINVSVSGLLEDNAQVGVGQADVETVETDSAPPVYSLSLPSISVSVSELMKDNAQGLDSNQTRAPH